MIFWLCHLHQRVVSPLVFSDSCVIFEVFPRSEMVLIANHNLSFFLYVVRLKLSLIIGVSILRATWKESQMIVVNSFFVLFIEIVAFFCSVMLLY